MLTRWVITVWGAWLGALGLASALTELEVWNPNPIVPVGLAVLMLTGGLGLVAAASARLVRGPRRDRALASLLVGVAPFWFLVGHVLLAFRPAFDRHVPPGWPSKVLAPLARPLADLEARWSYPVRTPGKWVTMVGAKADDARALVAAMDRHVEASLARLDRPATRPIVWNRGSLLGLRQCAVHDLAIGTEVGLYPRGADGLADLDRHEVAHCVISPNCSARSDPPRILMEGWAQANQGTPAEELADVAWSDREKGLSLPLKELVAPDWYWYSGLEAYNQGAPLVNYLLRMYGPERFLRLYTTCQQATFESDLRACLGVGLDELDAAYWADVERLVRTGPPARRWLKSLKLAPGVDPAAWDSFLEDYFAAAARLVAPYDHVRMTTTFRIERGAEDGGGSPEYEERLALLRSGPFARVRHRFGDVERAILAHPDHSLRASCKFTPAGAPWTIQDDTYQAEPQQAYRQAMEGAESLWSDNAFVATHGGAVLLQFPQVLEQGGLSTDYEVAGLDAETRDGRRLAVLRLSTSPGDRGRDRGGMTFVFDADDLFVARSLRYELPEGTSESEGRFEYDHSGGRPVLRSFVTTTRGSRRIVRLDVEECRFGPIPEPELGLEAFLTDLGPGQPDRTPEARPSTAMVLDRYWMAFVAGAISLAGGTGLAVGSRGRIGD